MPDPDQMNREELLEARTNVERGLSDLGYSSIIGGSGLNPSKKPALRKRLQEILAEIEQELAELDAQKPAQL